MTTYPLAASRALALHAQGLATPNGAEPPVTLAALTALVARLGCVQIDTLQMVQRSHYLALWSRLGNYAPADFDRLVYDPSQRQLFEGWQHAACLIPLEDYRYQIPHQRTLREGPGAWFRAWREDPANADLLEAVLGRIKSEGAVRAADFAYDGPKRGSWWDWKPAKVALEHLYAFGSLMISNRVNFQRVYDLTERVLPEWVDLTEPSQAERDAYWIEQGARVLGVCTLNQAADYAYRKRGPARLILQNFQARGVLAPIQVTLISGEVGEMVIHRENLPLLEQAADGALPPSRTTFLSPFDNLFWARGRDEQLWGFRQMLEAYKREPDRIWGYYCLPILWRDRLVGRFDPKLERQNGQLRLKHLYLEPGVEVTLELVTDLAAALRDFLAFHGAREVVIEHSQPAEFGERLAQAL